MSELVGCYNWLMGQIITLSIWIITRKYMVEEKLGEGGSRCR
jgi:hypothetical protein